MLRINFRVHIGSLALASVFLLAACSGPKALPMAPEAMLPKFLDTAAPRVRESYRFAIANPHEMEKYPCFCGCGNMGHTSNLSCYVKQLDKDGGAIFDEHAAGCGICVDITQDVMRMTLEGKAAPEIRTYVDAQYAQFGPSTDTPFPTN
jgi:hypothetical protein